MAIGSINDVAREIVPLMAQFSAPWCIAGGWAIDLFLDDLTRSHADIELAVFRQDQLLLQTHLREWLLEKIVDGRRVAWAEGERLELPVHEIHARRESGSPTALELLLNEQDATTWVYRRDASIHLPIEEAIVQSGSGVPILAPEIVLLFKSKSPRAKDAADFASTLPALNAKQRQWLRQSLAAAKPTHPWIEQLTVARGNA